MDILKKDWQPEPVRAWDEAVEREEAKVNAAWDEYRAKLNEQSRLLGCDAKEEAFEACLGELNEFAKRICSIPAHTFEGMAVKLRAHVRCGCEIEKAEMYLDDYALASIATDIERLTGKALS